MRRWDLPCSYLAGAVLVASMAMPTGKAASVAKALPPAVVEVDVFSGRENPRVALTDEESRRVRTMIAALRYTKIGRIGTPLGYRGFVFDLGHPMGPVRVFDGFVSRGQAGPIQLDEQRKVEKYLASIARPALDPSLAKLLP